MNVLFYFRCFWHFQTIGYISNYRCNISLITVADFRIARFRPDTFHSKSARNATQSKWNEWSWMRRRCAPMRERLNLKSKSNRLENRSLPLNCVRWFLSFMMWEILLVYLLFDYFVVFCYCYWLVISWFIVVYNLCNKCSLACLVATHAVVGEIPSISFAISCSEVLLCFFLRCHDENSPSLATAKRRSNLMVNCNLSSVLDFAF